MGVRCKPLFFTGRRTYIFWQALSSRQGTWGQFQKSYLDPGFWYCITIWKTQPIFTIQMLRRQYLVIGTSFSKGVLASARKFNKPGLTLGSLKLWSPSWRGPGTRPIHIFLGSEERGFRKQDQSYLGCGENHFENDTHFAFFIWPTAAFISALSWSLVLSFIALVAVILTMFLLIPVSCTFVIISSLRLKIYLVYSCLW